MNARYRGRGNFEYAGSSRSVREARRQGRAWQTDTDFSRLNNTGNNEQFLARTSDSLPYAQQRQDLKGDKDLKPPKINVTYERLTSCVKDYLSKFFDRKLLDGIYIHRDGLPAIVPNKDDTAAYASNEHEIWFNQGQYSPNTVRGIARIGHEVEHNYQWRRYTTAFALLYLGDSVGVFYSTGIASLAYPLNRFEVSARKKEKQILDDMEKNGNPCP